MLKSLKNALSDGRGVSLSFSFIEMQRYGVQKFICLLSPKYFATSFGNFRNNAFWASENGAIFIHVCCFTRSWKLNCCDVSGFSGAG